MTEQKQQHVPSAIDKTELTYWLEEAGKVIRGGVKIQKRDLETGDTKPQGSATLKDTAFDIISLNDNAVLVEGNTLSPQFFDN